MILELSFCVVGGANLGLEKSWELVQNLMNKYPHATWRRMINWKKGKGKYIIEID